MTDDRDRVRRPSGVRYSVETDVANLCGFPCIIKRPVEGVYDSAGVGVGASFRTGSTRTNVPESAMPNHSNARGRKRKNRPEDVSVALVLPVRIPLGWGKYLLTKIITNSYAPLISRKSKDFSNPAK
jgi:hypothetical protein